MPDSIPRWREDFPINWEDDHYVTRRSFTTFLTFIFECAPFSAQGWLRYENGGSAGDRRSLPRCALPRYRISLLDRPNSFFILPKPTPVY